MIEYEKDDFQIKKYLLNFILALIYLCKKFTSFKLQKNKIK